MQVTNTARDADTPVSPLGFRHKNPRSKHAKNGYYGNGGERAGFSADFGVESSKSLVIFPAAEIRVERKGRVAARSRFSELGTAPARLVVAHPPRRRVPIGMASKQREGAGRRRFPRCPCGIAGAHSFVRRRGPRSLLRISNDVDRRRSARRRRSHFHAPWTDPRTPLIRGKPGRECSPAARQPFRSIHFNRRPAQAPLSWSRAATRVHHGYVVSEAWPVNVPPLRQSPHRSGSRP
jgi:hypothetical protein